MLSGDIISLDVNKHNKISYIKKNILDSFDTYNDIKNLVLFDSEGNYLNNEDKIKDVLKQDDIINLIININNNEPPFKGDKWIFFKNSANFKPFYTKHIKKMNPIMLHKEWTTHINPKFSNTAWGRPPVQKFEGNLDDFLELPGLRTNIYHRDFNRHLRDESNMSKIQNNYLRLFRKSIVDLGYEDLVYAYAVYNTNDSRDRFELVATNKDSSIAYEFSEKNENVVYINGFRIKLLKWLFDMDKQTQLEFLQDL